MSLATEDLWPRSRCRSAWWWEGTSAVSRGHVGTATPTGHGARSAHQPDWETLILKGSSAGKSQKGYKMGSPSDQRQTLMRGHHCAAGTVDQLQSYTAIGKKSSFPFFSTYLLLIGLFFHLLYSQAYLCHLWMSCCVVRVSGGNTLKKNPAQTA